MRMQGRVDPQLKPVPMSRSPQAGGKRQPGGDFDYTPSKRRVTEPHYSNTYRPEYGRGPQSSGGRGRSPPRGPSSNSLHFQSDRVRPRESYDTGRDKERYRDGSRSPGRYNPGRSHRSEHRRNSSLNTHPPPPPDSKGSSSVGTFVPPPDRLLQKSDSVGKQTPVEPVLLQASSLATLNKGSDTRTPVTTEKAEETVALDKEASQAIATCMTEVFTQISHEAVELALLKSQVEAADKERNKKTEEYKAGKRLHEQFPSAEASQKKAKLHAEHEYQRISQKLREKDLSLVSAANSAALRLIPELTGAIGGKQSNSEEALTQQIECLEKSVAELQKKLEEQNKLFAEQKVSQQKQFESIEAKHQQDEATLQSLSTKLEKTQADLDTQKSESEKALEITKRDIDSAQTDVSRLKADLPPDLQQKLNTIGKLERQLETDKSETEAKVKDILEQEKDLRKEINTAKDDIKATGKNMLTLPTIANQPAAFDFASLKQQVVSLQQNPVSWEAIRSIQSQATSLESRITSIELDRLSALEKRIVSCEKDAKSTPKATELQTLRTDIEKVSRMVKNKEAVAFASRGSSPGKERPSPNELASSDLIARVTVLEANVSAALSRLQTPDGVDRLTHLEDTLGDFQVGEEAAKDQLVDEFEKKQSAMLERIVNIQRDISGMKSDLPAQVQSIQLQQSQSQNQPPSFNLDEQTSTIASRAIDILRERPDLIPTQAFEQKFSDQITSLRNSFELKTEAHINAITNLETRYNNINTMDMVRSMTDQLNAEKFPQIQQAIEQLRLPNPQLLQRVTDLEKLANERQALSAEAERRLQDLEKAKSGSMPDALEARIQDIEKEQQKVHWLVGKLEENTSKLHEQAASVGDYLKKIPNQETTAKLRTEVDSLARDVSLNEDKIHQVQKSQVDIRTTVASLASDNESTKDFLAIQIPEITDKINDIQHPPSRPPSPAPLRKSIPSTNGVKKRKADDTNGHTHHKASSNPLMTRPNGRTSSYESPRRRAKGRVIYTDDDPDGDFEAKPDAPSGDDEEDGE
ncbi:hypothetical protein G7Y89_g9810 [Cudoniella acicularis]|uniref:Uncharacterized protein n=1 Tax=Cudoniella acicularis TaxID=354080 RepID=A0A8H4RDY6_9HELO|nr:hypothetical protein G7Y89_g9810 [Cudoniella acicularis]